METEHTMQIIEVKDYPFIESLTRAVKSKKKQAIVPKPSVKAPLRGTLWDNDTQYKHFQVDIETLVAAELPHYDPPERRRPQGVPSMDLTSGTAVVRVGKVDGWPITPVVYLHPDDYPKMVKKTLTVRRIRVPFGWDKIEA